MIELKNVSKTYLMGMVEVKALRGVSLRIAPGEFVAIMGPSGSGKSTLMHVLGLLDRTDSGQYRLGRQEVSALPDEDLSALRNRLMGFVFQQFHLLPRMTALDNVILPLIYGGKRNLEERAKQEIRDVGLSDRIYHRPNELSGGQQQRVAIARALINDPLIILADEPTGNLDSKSKQEIMTILRKLNERGKTLIIVTHEPEVAQQAKRIIRMIDGQIVSDERLGAAVKIADERQADVIINNVLSKSEKASRKTEFLDYLHQAGRAMLSHKMRSFLSVLGILIGVAAVIAMLAVGQGAKDSIEKQLASLGSNLLMVRAGSPKVHGVAMESGATTRFTFQDVTAIEKLTGVVARVSPDVRGRGQMVYADKNWNTSVEG
ncbi:MAG: ATP-binding cassette domain-containing protein, partial [Candidatus Omnitrophica bacterium]|nr:ATP-binding cassette domain-containing protein [Candidatus Omnitrophota bacterium]